MLSRHTNELMNRLDRVLTRGFTEILKAELLQWYNQEKLSIGIWRDLADKWSETLVQNGWGASEVKLFAGKDDETFVLIWGEGLTASPESWFCPLDELHERLKRKPKREDIEPYP